MKTFIFAFGLFLFANTVLGEVINLNEIIQKANANETNDLTKILNDISLEPATDPSTGRSVFKVKKVTAGSIYDKAGVKVGDLVATDNSSNANGMQLKGTLRKTVPQRQTESGN